MKLRTRFERFCYRNRNKGIPNLMLYLGIGSAVVYFMSLFAGSNLLYYILCFDRASILHGQVWRLFTYPLTYGFLIGNPLLMLISLFCYFSMGRAMENQWGTFRFNLYYLSGILMMDIFCMIFGGMADVTFLNTSLFLGYATLYPNAQFLFMFIIPVKAWIFVLVDLGLTLYYVYLYAAAGTGLYCLFPLVALLNYFLFFGKDVLNVFPLSWRANTSRLFRKKKKAQTNTIPFPTAGSYQASHATVKAPYTHRCIVCGRTDVSNPELEFRYCSRCNGYYCYCQEHINNHAHIE